MKHLLQPIIWLRENNFCHITQHRLCGSGGVPPSPKLSYATLRATSYSRGTLAEIIFSRYLDYFLLVFFFYNKEGKIRFSFYFIEGNKVFFAPFLRKKRFF